QTFGSSWRNDVSRIANKKQAAEPHRFGHKAAQRRDALFDRRAGYEALSGVIRQPSPQLIPKACIGPVFDLICERALDVISAARLRAHATKSKTALVIGVNEFVGNWRGLGKHAKPTEWIFALEHLDRTCGNAGPAHAVKAIAAGDEIAFNGLLF